MDTAVREAWRKTCVSAEKWQRHIETAQPGEAGGFYVKSLDSGLVAYMKPLRKSPVHPRAAYEKIAADLAYEAQVPVCPVLLYRRPEIPEADDSKAEGEPRQVALSLVAPVRWEWKYLFDFSRADGGIPAQLPAMEILVRQILGNASGIVALDAWLRNTDRHNDRNAVLACHSPNTSELIFIDYANTMDHDGEWSKGKYQEFSKVRLPSFFINCLRKDDVENAAKRISDLKEEVISGIVSRIPDDFLAPDRRQMLIEWLIWRKAKLYAAIGDWYSGN